MSTDATFQFSRALARLPDVMWSHTDFTSYPLKSVYLLRGESWKSQTGEGQDVIAAAVVVWFHWRDVFLHETQPSGCGALEVEQL